MRTGRFGGLLLAAGAVVGVVAVVGLVMGFEPARLPAALLNVAAYKLTFAAAAGLLAAGAIIRRHSNRASQNQDASQTSRTEEVAPPLMAGDVDFAPKREPQAEIRVPKQR